MTVKIYAVGITDIGLPLEENASRINNLIEKEKKAIEYNHYNLISVQAISQKDGILLMFTVSEKLKFGEYTPANGR